MDNVCVCTTDGGGGGDDDHHIDDRTTISNNNNDNITISISNHIFIHFTHNIVQNVQHSLCFTSAKNVCANNFAI